MALQVCTAQAGLHLSRSSFSNYRRRRGIHASADNPSRRLALFQLGTGFLAMLNVDWLSHNNSTGLPVSIFNSTSNLRSHMPSHEPVRGIRCEPGLLGENASKLLGTKGNKPEGNALVSDLAQAATLLSDGDVIEWAKSDKRRFLHVVYRVGDLDKTIKFYTECLGMKVLRKRDISEDGYSNAFLGYGPEDSQFSMELTYNYGVDNYDIGTGFGHFGFAVENVAKTVDLVKFKGGRVIQEPTRVRNEGTIVAAAKDPDGYTCKLIEKGPTPEPLCQIMLRVGDIDRSINFYKKAFGMELLQKRDNSEYKNTKAIMGYGPEDKNAVLELVCSYGVRNYSKGTGYAQIAISTDDVYKTAEAIKICGGEIIREPGPLPGINTKITVCLDPDGWKTVFVDNIDFLKELEG